VTAILGNFYVGAQAYTVFLYFTRHLWRRSRPRNFLSASTSASLFSGLYNIPG